MPNAQGKPIVLVVTNMLNLADMREELIEGIDARFYKLDPFRGWNDASKDGGPDIVAIGCVVTSSYSKLGVTYADFIASIRSPTPEGPGFTGPILGLCEACKPQHLDAGCDEVVQCGRDAAQRILELAAEISNA